MYGSGGLQDIAYLTSLKENPIGDEACTASKMAQKGFFQF